MNSQYAEIAKVFKALSDPKRVKIVDLLSCGEMCGCVLLKCFEITQPTLAHDMKVLTEAGIVTSRRDGKKTIYALNKEAVGHYRRQVDEIFRDNSGNGSC